MTRYQWVEAEKAKGDYPTSVLCRTAEVTPQGFSRWNNRELSANDVFNNELENAIVRIHAESDGDYGVPMVTAELRREGHRVNRKRVARLMRKLGLQGAFKRSKVRTTIPSGDNPAIPDLVGRSFDPGEPDVAWVGDITYVPTTKGWLYLATVIDLGSRRLLGYAMADHMRTSLIEDALKMAVGFRSGNVKGVIFHSDRGSQYLSNDYRQLLATHQMRQSIGRTGVCWDNAVAESFFATLKREVVFKHKYDDHAQARQTIFAWANRYNNKRLHSTLGYIPPAEWETNKQTTAAQKAA